MTGRVAYGLPWISLQRDAARAVAGPFVPPLHALRLWRLRRRFRADLRRLSEVGPHLIDDIGLDLKEAAEEIGKPFWRT
jgi:uncharacterized protein YjiS (DUF1127 family)